MEQLRFDTGEYFEARLGDFLFNAGVVGLIRTLRYADNYADGCREGADYIIDGQSLYFSRDYMTSHNMGRLFVEALVKNLGDSTKFKRVFDKKSALDALYADPKPEDKAWLKSADEIYKEFADMLTKNSFKSGYVILSQMEGVRPIDEQMVLDLKKEKDLTAKKAKYDALHELVGQKQAQIVLMFKDILYAEINMFYADNKGNGAAFLSKREIDPAAAFNEKFVAPLIAEADAPAKKKTSGCIQCGESMSEAVPLSIFVDTADDLGKKKSYYWNCKPDAYLCPFCAFICAFAPLGFHYFGNDGVFVNNNTDIPTLLSFADALSESDEDSTNSWYRIYNTFTSQKLDKLSERVNNIQVVIRDKENSKYFMNTVDKQVISVLRQCRSQLAYIRSRYVKNAGEYINVYQEVVSNLLARRSQYLLISSLLRIIASEGGPSSYLFDILQIQITQKGGENMEANQKRAYVAKMQGQQLRAILTSDQKTETDKDNKLRGLVYQLLNAVSLGNRDKFLELVLRTYAGSNAPVPDIFFSCFGSDEDFKEIGFAYLLGLKSEGSSKKETA